MSDIADRYRKVAGQFTARVDGVPDGAWDHPAPCDGWVARDIVRHLVDWLPGFFFGTWGIDVTAGPAVDDDPAAAWDAVNRAIQRALDDPEVAASERDTRMGRSSFEQTINTICINDLLIHTWDLARATGQDERLDPAEVRAMLADIQGFGDALEQSGHYGPRVPVDDAADEQTKLIAFTGRQP